MITPDWVRMMATYNARINRRIYEAAGQLEDHDRKRDRGAFFGSVHATLNHLLWGDLIWMSRFAGSQPPEGGIQAGLTRHPEFATLADERMKTDAQILTWAEELEATWLAGDLSWFSGATQREITAPKAMLVTHMFNHQTHHRGQVHAMLTAAGVRPAETDLFLVVQV